MDDAGKFWLKAAFGWHAWVDLVRDCRYCLYSEHADVEHDGVSEYEDRLW